jgi:hypothetical protein
MNAIYTFTVPLFIKTLGGLKTILSKAEVHGRETGLSDQELLETRLASDMFPLVTQVRIACDNAKLGTARLAGMEAPKFDDTETTIAELIARIDKTVTFIQSVPESVFADAATRQIVLSYLPDKYMTGFDYAREYLLPNFFFHVTIAYGIIRMKGVAIGKADYTNGVNFRNL